MPELPEVETVRSGLAQHLVGAVVTSIEVFDARSLKKNVSGAQGFLDELTGSTLQAVVRRGKFLWLPISGSRAMVGHLGMSGQILVRTPGFESDPQTRVVIHVVSASGDELEIRFVDQRLFGGLAIDDLVETTDGKPGGYSPEAASGAMIPATVSHIARDLLDPDFDAGDVASRMVKKNSGIKRVLLDQNLLSGIGNIYADESLWLAKLHYDRLASSISKKKHLELIEIAKAVLVKAVAQGGTSFDEQYKNVNGESGYFSQSLNAYGMTGLPCNRCGTPIKREAWANRGSHFCPRCQKR
ncbi:bifunctional DNA-formamidopyrimidine glycosylase/DNA-(apurinic or apyrimidinic site) lyase [Aquiluna borgnonia]|uniref:Bifunctional DNA-formamidopyrimidine glycosylase/DNA-(Apurinic or apyrimidinic site) lyase n=1 Tax=Aquiluna borgnonia TaxID=2499157 RepID=A0A7D4QFY3_9MICO|nr:bifunctional DNA-formamidopyrimidine glycosylase/DNA-(apurinic or apyrimidinic site) lyase [Aquiluna borgnonia]QKJ25068.1 bifunctional DNA-formamidopyrimidine glycosylase/DNA-(apurinic or apyrimidinic site) lyase [Aquiluna borgnonia]